MSDRTATLEQEKEQAYQSLNINNEYLKDVIYCLSNKLPESERWVALQEISKLDRKSLYHDNQNTNLIVDYVSHRLGFSKKEVM
jgi:hypothetical protein